MLKPDISKISNEERHAEGDRCLKQIAEALWGKTARPGSRRRL